MPNNDRGKPENITTKTFEAAANAMASRPRKQGKTPTNSWRKSLRLKKSPKTRTGNPDNWFLFSAR
jgi:hypothetical protein